MLIQAIFINIFDEESMVYLKMVGKVSCRDVYIGIQEYIREHYGV